MAAVRNLVHTQPLIALYVYPWLLALAGGGGLAGPALLRTLSFSSRRLGSETGRGMRERELRPLARELVPEPGVVAPLEP